MTSALSAGLSGLLAYQRAINVHSQNIANVNTEGYVRQQVEFTQRGIPGRNGATEAGGVAIARVRREVNDFLFDQGRQSLSAAARADELATKAAQLSQLLGSADYGLDDTLRSLRNAIESLSTEPTSLLAREQLFVRLQLTVERFVAMDARISSYREEVNARLQAEVSRTNSFIQQIAGYNAEIAQQSLGGREASGILLDARDRALDELSRKITLEITRQSNGMVNVATRHGLLLVNGSSATELAIAADSFDPAANRVVVKGGFAGNDVDRQLTGGVLGGLIDVRNQLLSPAQNELGRIVASLAIALNEINASGDDLSGSPSGAIFNLGQPLVRAAGGNTGTASLQAEFATAAGLTGSDYLIERTASGWSVKRLQDGVEITPSGAGTSTNPFLFDGLKVVVDNGGSGPAAGDRFMLQPTRNVVESLALAIENGTQFAAALAGAGVGDNRNARAMVDFFDQPWLRNGQQTITDAAARLNLRLRSSLEAAELTRDVQQQSASEALTERQDRYGVNLDQEAAELLRFQQAYQASAQVIRIANELFDTLLDAAR
jgi:flagellar hook-associated protein 1 FlgK